ncbi:hypothetical protein BP5796_05595 [Coleophoma crateriformis]|uniref:Glycoside hydrolase family 5 domain-containing protein n=1 Tax=Coleophoma crateriformis TaxID=565419 RepID=A0A3D8S3K9_9HELO|nr:hypothetical protein BP5796_05595 [Coleophoma crateriformis]
MHLPKLLSFTQLLLSLPLVASSPARYLDTRASWPYGPLSTKGRWILDSAGHNITYAGANWPGAADTMIPEGLQYSSIAGIVGKLKEMGMNVIRLTYAIEMVDDYYANGMKDTSILTSFQKALGTENGTAVFNAVVKNNPTFSANTTRMQVFDAIAAECLAQEVYVHLDNHMSKAKWCCSTDDGNSWFGDTDFNVTNWLRGLHYMATRASGWGALVSMSLRNELRSPDDNATLVADAYNWANWYENVVPAMNAINSANPDTLIFLSGLGFDTNMSPIPTAASLGSNYTFLKSDFSYADKLVIELHNYATTATNCTSLEASLYTDGYNAMNPADPSVVNVFPVVMTEWGHGQDAATYQAVYQTCLASYLTGIKGGWMVWVLAGGYYIREGVQDYDETWGLLNHNWTAFRDEADVVSVIEPMVAGTKIF